jgi:RNA polymerase sigma factor (sigma-70 family)
MHDASDMELLRDYHRQGSEAAFAELVQRHINPVYSTALRHVGIATHAEEITQAVFVILARKAAGLRPDTVLDAWLYETTRLTSLSFLRGERRRQFREHEAYMQSTLPESTDASVWLQLAPLLDEAMARLGKKDREAVVLRFFKEKNLGEVAAAMKITEAAAQSRVHRAVEKLRTFFLKRGIDSTAAAIAETISANSVQAAPVGLAKVVTAIAMAKGAAASTSTLTLIKGALKIMAWTKMKFACGVGAGLLLAGSVVTVAIAGKNPKQPDPVALLKGVAAAREKIKSGEMEFLDAHRDSRWHIQTNYILLKVAFDGEKLRFEQLAREYAYVPTDPEAIKRVEEKYYELHGDNDTLVKLGLLTPQSAHYRTIYDGNVIMEFDPRLDATIQNSNADIGTFLFDPRTFGLNGYMFHGDTVEGCLGLQNLKPVSLVGKEDVDGIPAWRVNVQVATNWPIEFWIDAAHPTHVI